jgi:membrane protease YdiL (CAAX protease family)
VSRSSPQAPPPPGSADPLVARPDAGASAWRPWTAPAALAAGYVFAALGSLLVYIPAAAAGVHIRSGDVPPGIEIADTFVQDLVFVAVAVFFAQLGGRAVAAYQFGLRPTRFWRALRLAATTIFLFLAFSLIWTGISQAPKEKLLEQLGASESALLLILSASLTCVVAPVCEEILFRGFIFRALRNWRGTWPAAIITGVTFGAVHAGSAPAADLVPLAVLGFALCLLYERSGSLYPCIVVHSLNNAFAFGDLEGWTWWQILALMIAALAIETAGALALKRAGVIAREPAGVIGTG